MGASLKGGSSSPCFNPERPLVSHDRDQEREQEGIVRVPN